MIFPTSLSSLGEKIKSAFQNKFPWKEGSFCFYCNVDSDELRTFLLLLIGSLVFSSVLVGFGLWLKGYFKNNEALKYKIFEVENNTDH